MASAGSDAHAAYQAYRAEIAHQVMAPSLQTGVRVVVALNLVFILFDYLGFPDKFHSFLIARLFTNAILLAVGYWGAARWPVAGSFVGCFATGGMLLWVIYGAGGATSEYSPGLMLLFVGIPVLLPFSAGQAATISGTLFLAYAASPWVLDTPVVWRDYALKVAFPLAAALESVASTAAVDRIRFRDFKQRAELRRARDELQKLDVAKARFTANVHHELRTPLTLTLAPVEALLAGQFGEVSELQRSYLQTIRSNALRLLKLINNLLDLAKIESDQLRIQRRPVQLGSLIQEIVRGAVPLAERKHVRLECSRLEVLPTIQADPDALEKIVVNLIGNALKFTDAQGRIRVEGSADGEGVHLVVADTGIGIPPDQLERIFDRFAQVDSSTTRRFEGTGIGLSLVKELVELHGGRVYAESDGLGTGTRMHVLLPYGAADAEAEEPVEEAVLSGTTGAAHSPAAMAAEFDAGASEASAPADLRLSELRDHVARGEGGEAPRPAGAGPVAANAPEVLVVEDNPDMRRLLAFLVGQEFRVRTARNGREGLEALRERAPDVVLTDVMMPEMSGVELCAAIKGDPATAGIPVVLVTSKAEREMKIEGLERGADDYVTKPFHPRELLARVRALVRLRGLQAELAVRNALLESTNVELRSTLGELREAGAQLVQAERLAAVGELAAGIAHEVNNPVNYALNSMKVLRSYVEDVRTVAAGFAALSGESPEALTQKLRELEALRAELGFDENVEALAELGEIVTEGLERTSRLVGDLRDFAAPGDRRSADVDVARSLRSTLQLVRHVFAEAGVALEDSIAPDLAPVEGDARALNQVFLNLLKNAAEAFEGRRGRVQVCARPEGGTIVVEIRDDGPGIAPEIQARLFEPFFTTKPAGRGTGLGLSISQRIVSEHGGRIEIESAPGSGTCVRVWLPTRDAAQQARSARQERGDASQA
jgi:signal transduction histidine kinase